MLKILCVDDDLHRRSVTYDALLSLNFLTDDNIVTVSCADEARLELKNNHFDLLILDVVIPKRVNELPDAACGIKLLDDIPYKRTLRTPSTIIGITAFEDVSQSYYPKFKENTFCLVHTKRNSTDWINILLKKVEWIFESYLSKNVTNQRAVLTISGIRSFGCWQDSLTKLTKKFDSTIDFKRFSYGFFSSFEFIFPSARDRLVKKLIPNLSEFLSTNSQRKICIVAHSFGTYLIVNALRELIKKDEFPLKIETLILSGSVLSEDDNLNDLLAGGVKSIVNDCGTSDLALLVSKSFVPGTGMAGRVGFVNLCGEQMVNRIFKGGHSLYFSNQSDFMATRWVPILLGDELSSDCVFADPSFFDGVMTSVANGLSRFKKN